MSSPRPEFVALASGFLAGPWTQESLIERGGAMLAARPRWLRHLVGRVLEAFPDPPRSARDALAVFLTNDEKLRRDLARLPSPHIKTWLVDAPRMSPTRFNVPFINTWADLAGFCGVDVPLLDWLSNRRSWGRKRDAKLLHYRYTWVPKRRGGYRVPARRVCARVRCTSYWPPRRHPHGPRGLLRIHARTSGRRSLPRARIPRLSRRRTCRPLHPPSSCTGDRPVPPDRI